MLQPVPSNCHHLYEYGAVPPLAVAVSVIGVPAICGAVLSAVRLVSVSAGGALIANGSSRKLSYASAVLPALRPQTMTFASALAVAGRQTTVAFADQSWNTVQA